MEGPATDSHILIQFGILDKVVLMLTGGFDARRGGHSRVGD